MVSLNLLPELIVSLLLMVFPALGTEHSADSVVATDTAEVGDPRPFWGKVDCAEHSDPLTPGHTIVESGGDTHPTATGEPQGNSSFRRLTVFDGDDVSGERCELGYNDQGGPTAFYHEGDHLLTYASLRLPETVPIDAEDWRVVLQMKQAQPYNNPGQASIFTMEVRDGRWEIGSDWKSVWSTPASQNTWTRFIFDIVYSQDPTIGSIKIKVDLNDDGDYIDDVNGDGQIDESSPVFRQRTLVTETEGDPEYTIEPGDAIPSHLRAGIYQNEVYSCPRSGPGCSVDVDNVQIVRG